MEVWSLIIKNNVWGEQEEGERQGNSEASAFFAVALHKDVKRLDEEAAASGGRALFGNDDGYVIGPRVEAKAALDNFRDRIWTR